MNYCNKWRSWLTSIKTLKPNLSNPSMQSSTHTFERFVQIQSHLNLLNYTHWSRLNTLYFTQVNSDSLAFPGIFTFCLWLLETVVWQVRRINHNSHEALLEIPEGRFSEPDLLNIHSVSQPLVQLGVHAPLLHVQEYRNLPGVLLVEARDMRAVVKSSKFVKIKKKEFQGRSTVSLRGAKEELLTLGNTWYLSYFYI